MDDKGEGFKLQIFSRKMFNPNLYKFSFLKNAQICFFGQKLNKIPLFFITLWYIINSYSQTHCKINLVITVFLYFLVKHFKYDKLHRNLQVKYQIN